MFLSEDIASGLDYDGPAAALPASQMAIVNLMEPLVAYADAGTNQDGVGLPDFNRFEGRLAQSWSYDPATRAWRVHLRPNVRSCFGSILNADDVVYTFARAKSVSGAAPIGWFLANAASVDGFTTAVFHDPAARTLGPEVRKVDELTVEIVQSAPNALFLPVLTIFGLGIFDKRAMDAHATPADPWAHDFANNQAAPGYGAYCVESWLRGDRLVLSANRDYYRGMPAVDRVVIKRVPQSSNRFIILRMGEADLTEHLTPREARALEPVATLRVAGVTGNETLFLHMNFATKPFDNPALRRAIAYALPYDQIIRTGYLGHARKWDGVVPSAYPGAVKADRPFGYDPDRAKALLAEAGYPDGRGLERYADAFRLAYVAEKETALGPIATVVRSALRAIGIPAELDPIPSAQFGDRQLVKKDLAFALNDQEKPIGVDAGYAVMLFFQSTAAGGLNNMVNYANPEVDRLWAAARNQQDAGARTALLRDIQQRLIADVAWLPLVEYETRWAMTRRLSGLRWYPDNAVRFFDLRLDAPAP